MPQSSREKQHTDRSRPSRPRSTVLFQREFTLRGGFLKKPIVPRSVRVGQGSIYIVCWKNCPDLSSFLAQGSSCQRALAKTTIFEDIKTARNDTLERIRRDMTDVFLNPKVDGDAEAEDGPGLGLLDLDEEETASVKGPSLKKEIKHMRA